MTSLFSKTDFDDLCKKFKTPLYLYSEEKIRTQAKDFLNGFSSHPSKVFFALKANLNPSLLKIIFSEGLGADVVSGGELLVARKSGLPADKIVFSGVGKTAEELRLATDEKIHAIQVESTFELDTLDEIGAGKETRISLRVNLDIDAHTHPHITTATRANKFGISEARLGNALAQIRDQGRNLVGISCHLGSQITELDPFRQGARKMVALAKRLKESGFPIEFVSLGGGLGISYRSEEAPPSLTEYASSILPEFKGSTFRLHLEPGRWIVAESGILLTRVLGVKRESGSTFVVVDAGMNDLLRPALYQAHHTMIAVNPRPSQITATVVGPVCESADTFLYEARIPDVYTGDLVFFENAGAYGMSMASTYNGRARPAELLVTGEKTVCIRKRETIEELTLA